MPFGLSGAPRTFQRLIDKLLKGLSQQMAMAYLDDIIVFASTVSDMVDRLKIIFGRLRSAGLKLKDKEVRVVPAQNHLLGPRDLCRRCRM